MGKSTRWSYFHPTPSVFLKFCLSTDCTNEALRGNVPECISKFNDHLQPLAARLITSLTPLNLRVSIVRLIVWWFLLPLSAGRLSYDVNPEKKELRVNVSDVLEDRNYNLRLCHKDFICVGTGAYTLVRQFVYSKWPSRRLFVFQNSYMCPKSLMTLRTLDTATKQEEFPPTVHWVVN